MLYKISTGKTVSAIAEAMPAAAAANLFGVMLVHNFREIMAKKGVEFTRECLVFEVCQPQQAKHVLETEMDFSTVLPCRISVYEENGKTVLATLKPTALVAMLNAPMLTEVAQEVEKSIIKIMQDAAIS